MNQSQNRDFTQLRLLTRGHRTLSAVSASRPPRTGLNKLLLALVVSASLGGCKKPAAPADGAPSSSSSAGSAAASGPCDAYASKLCDKAGAQSSTCENIRGAAEVLPPEACTTALTNIDYSFKKIATLTSACDELIRKACAAVGPNTQTCQMVTTQTKQFPPDRCKQMLQHMPEVAAQLKQMEEGNKPLSKELQAAITQGAAPSFGPADAKVQIVEFSDFQCPYCSKAAETVHRVKEKYGSRVHFVFRQFPLPMHPNARVAAEAALSANREGKFWEFHDRLFQHQHELDRTQLEEQAKAAGLNVAAFKKSLDTKEFAPVVDSDVKLGEQVHVNGTPTVFVNGARVADPTNFEAFSAIIESALKGSAPG